MFWVPDSTITLGGDLRAWFGFRLKVEDFGVQRAFECRFLQGLISGDLLGAVLMITYGIFVKAPGWSWASCALLAGSSHRTFLP